jgi:hypothetical protein
MQLNRMHLVLIGVVAFSAVALSAILFLAAHGSHDIQIVTDSLIALWGPIVTVIVVLMETKIEAVRGDIEVVHKLVNSSFDTIADQLATERRRTAFLLKRLGQPIDEHSLDNYPESGDKAP